MPHVKNLSKQNFEPKQTDNNEKNRSQEVELPIPEKKNDTITANTTGKPEMIPAKAVRINNDETNQDKNKEKVFHTGFDVNNTNGKKKDKRGNEYEKLVRVETNDPKTKDANWQHERINEANNQPVNKQNYRKTYKGNDTRKDSIIDRPKTETYENVNDENAGDIIKKGNYTHTPEEEKRDKINRRMHEKSIQQRS